MTIIQNILDTIASPTYDTIIIHRHQNPDPDALGSQGGLQKLIQNSFPEKQVFVVGEEVPSLSFIHAMDTIEDEVYTNALVIVTDTGNTARISDDRYTKGKTIIKIDHHPDLESYGDISWVDTSFSSASEMIFHLYEQSQGVLKLDHESARLLFTGIIGDTGRFRYDNTTSRTLDAASRLIKEDFNPQELYQNLYQEPLKVSRFKGYVLQNFTVSVKGVASMYISKELMDDFGLDRTEAANLVYVLQGIEGVNIWTFFVESDDQIRVRIRSSEVHIDETARKYNGGGHPLASGASVNSEEEQKQLLADLDNLI